MRSWRELSQHERNDYRENRREYIGRPCTLNSQLANTAFDAETGFAMICPLNPTFGDVPFSWSAVFNIIDNHNGEF